MTRLYYDHIFYRTLKFELKRLGFTSCSPWKKNEVASFCYRDVTVSIFSKDTIRISTRDKSEEYPVCNVGAAIALIVEEKQKAERA